MIVIGTKENPHLLIFLGPKQTTLLKNFLLIYFQDYAQIFFFFKKTIIGIWNLNFKWAVFTCVSFKVY